MYLSYDLFILLNALVTGDAFNNLRAIAPAISKTKSSAVSRLVLLPAMPQL
ncbi:MAG: hypothetical protein SFY66_07590 [Oculatellaceae cyanobacterium bins.114]|nr:hypothetical protein [Oculatellaceae cyanobacterium bins.114]